MTNIMNSIAMLTLIVSFSFTWANPSDGTSEDSHTSFTGVWFVQLDDRVLMEMGRIELDASFLRADGSFDMERIKASFRMEETVNQQGLAGKKALISIFDEVCLSETCQSEMAEDCFSETGSAQCLDNPIEEGWCLFTQEQHRQSICFSCSQSCDAFILE